MKHTHACCLSGEETGEKWKGDKNKRDPSNPTARQGRCLLPADSIAVSGTVRSTEVVESPEAARKKREERSGHMTTQH